MRAFSRLKWIFVILSLLLALPIQAQDTGGVTVTCPGGFSITNGVEVTVNMRPGFTYTATVLGIDGFNPIIAVQDQNGVQECVDDSPESETFTADLPTTGVIPAAATNAQTTLSHNFGGPSDISLVIGEASESNGQFVLIIEGLAVTPDDGSGPGSGDFFSVRLTPDLLESSVPITAYMISVTGTVDSLVQLVGDDRIPLLDNRTGKNLPVECDDAGDATACWDVGASLENAQVSRTLGRNLFGGPKDASISIMAQTVREFTPQSETPDALRANFLMTSFRQVTVGDYVAVFHIGTGTGSGATAAPFSTQPPPPTFVATEQGVNVTCPDGTEITNGVELLVNMRAGFRYTATAIGIDGFDPIMAIENAAGVQLCVDDSREASTYTADLPTSGLVGNSNVNSQAVFSLDPLPDEIGDVSIIVSGFRGAPGEFVLVLEGMAITPEDGDGDPFTMNVTPNLVASGVPVTAYMVAVTGELDSLINLADPNLDVTLNPNGDTIMCDDAGTDTCWGESDDLSGYYISRTRDRLLNGHPTDALLSIPLAPYAAVDPSGEYLLDFLMSSERRTRGDYLVVFHVGIGGPGGN
ncbi:MAG: hypothetical protein H6671_05610 [Anaerolineaceae bacterium]|nr:hypothetical protein [Anaerolineaceae bacterium]